MEQSDERVKIESLLNSMDKDEIEKEAKKRKIQIDNKNVNIIREELDTKILKEINDQKSSIEKKKHQNKTKNEPVEKKSKLDEFLHSYESPKNEKTEIVHNTQPHTHHKNRKGKGGADKSESESCSSEHEEKVKYVHDHKGSKEKVDEEEASSPEE
jgi:hypothetical protein